RRVLFRSQKELLRSTGVWGVHQQVSSGKVDSQANCLLKLWYQQALLAASLESIWHSFLSIDLSCLLRNSLTWIKQTKVFFKESFQLFNNSLFLLISWTPAAKT